MKDHAVFFNALHRLGYRDLRAISTDKSVVRSFGFAVNGNLSNVEDFVTTYTKEHLNIFVGVAERLHMNGRQLKDCGLLRALFVDLDFKAVSEDAAREALAAFSIPPSMVIATGGGLHCYWFLEVPLDLTTDHPRARQILLALAKKLGGDLAAATPERILRVPGTLNFKYAPPPPVELESFTEVIYPLDTFLDLLGPLPTVRVAIPTGATFKHNLTVEERIKLAKTWLAARPGAVEGSGGDNETYKVCCAVTIGHDLTADQAMVALADWNKRCEPPWTDHDLRGKIDSAIRYGTGNRGEQLQTQPKRKLILTPASRIQIRPVHWCWQDRLALGSFALLGGREGIGKSMLAYLLAADISTGRLPGAGFRTARSVIIAAAEDSWEHTIVPRLMAAKADLNKIFRIEVTYSDGAHASLSLPKDINALERSIIDNEVALVLLDPLMSRLDAKLDSHKDAEVRIALEPLSQIADRTNCVVLGIIHVNKSSSTDPLTMLMGSRAFAAVARAVLFVIADPENIKGRMMGQPKNNLGEIDELPTKLFHIERVLVGKTDEGEVYTGKLVWDGDTTDRTVADEIETTAEGVDRPAVTEAAEWLVDYLKSKQGYAESSEVKHEAKRKRHSLTTLQRARKYAHVECLNRGTFPRITYWCLPGVTPLEEPPPEGQVEIEY